MGVAVMAADLVMAMAVAVVVMAAAETAAKETAMPDKSSRSIDTAPQSADVQECHYGT